MKRIPILARLPLNSLLACALFGFCATAHAATARTLEYVILSAGHRSGSEVDRYGANGSLDSEFEFNDRGRGPKTESHYEFGSDGLPVRIDVTGINYLKAKVDEHFLADASGASWHSELEHGKVVGKAFYVTTDGTGSAELAALVRGLAHSPSGQVALLPGGEARVEFVAQTTLESHGHNVHVREAAISGLDVQPSPVWVDDNGDLFAIPGTWLAIMRTGWEDTNETLFKLQSDA